MYTSFCTKRKNIAWQKLHAIEIDNLVLLIFFYILKSPLKRQTWPSRLSEKKKLITLNYISFSTVQLSHGTTIIVAWFIPYNLQCPSIIIVVWCARCWRYHRSEECGALLDRVTVTRGYTSRPIINQSISQSLGRIIGMRPFETRSAFTARNSRRRETRDHLMSKYVNGVRFEFSYAVLAD